MKNFFILLIIAIPLIAASNLKAQSLLQNGSAEYYDTTTLWPEGWTAVTGNWRSEHYAGHTSDAHDSTHIFFEGGDAEGTLQQDVNVNGYIADIDAGLQYFTFSGWVQSKAEVVPADETAITVQCLDATKAQVLYVWNSDTTASVNAWTQKINIFQAPVGTRHIRIRLMAFRNQGSTNDGYFDDIILIASTATQVMNVVNKDIVNIYPNPANDVIHVSFNMPGTYKLDVTTMLGNALISRSLNGSANLDVSTLPSGMYFLKVVSEDKTSLQNIKFIKN